MPNNKNLDKQTKLSFQLGGTTPMPGTGVINTPTTAPTTGFTPYVAPAIPGFTGPQLQNTQYTTATQTTNLPTFLQTVGTKPGEYDEFRRYVNDAGQVRQIPFKNGQPIYPIPEGYRFEAEDTTQVTAPTTGPVTTVGQTQDGGGDGDGGVGVGAGTSVSGYPGRTGVEGLKSAFSNFGSYDTTTPPSENPYGVTGQRGINLGALASIATGIPGLGSLVDSEMGLFGYGPSAGFPGGNVDTSMSGGVRGMSRSDLEGIMSGAFSPSDYDDFGFGVTASQARAAVSAANVLGLETITGVYGYKKGDAIAGVRDGFIDSKGVGRNVATGELNGHYEDIGAFIDRMSMSRADKDKADAAAGQAAVANTMAEQQAAQAARTAARRGSDSTPGDTPSSSTPSSPSTGRGIASGNYGQDMGPHGDSAGTASDNAADDDMGDDGIGGGASTGADDDSDDDEAYCLTEDMKVKLNGTINFVTNIKVGDMIDNYKVKEVLHKHMRSGYYAINNELKISNDHPVLANGTWTRPEDLVVGDSINGISVTSLEYVERMTPTVSIVIDGESFDVHTENNIYTVHGRYREVRQEAA